MHWSNHGTSRSPVRMQGGRTAIENKYQCSLLSDFTTEVWCSLAEHFIETCPGFLEIFSMPGMVVAVWKSVCFYSICYESSFLIKQLSMLRIRHAVTPQRKSNAICVVHRRFHSRCQPLPYPSPVTPYFAYFFVYSAAVLLNLDLSFLNISAALVSTASSGTGSTSRFCVAAKTLKILLLGFQASGFRMPMHMLPCSSKVTFGCQIRVLKLILGGLKG